MEITDRKQISFDDGYTGEDFTWWSRALVEIANHFGEYINPQLGWSEIHDQGKTPIEAFLEEYPEHTEAV
ncbi:hypothetical protein [Endozoicomonas ascidiicola]|uniref:hypothetical protein n=1 Tax=Endozoicomonas ascidiicola TaxID=1698521 RepID=UPI0008316A80|nr:hypothetical protein [Endozoicomonas ascidiicola]